MSGHTYYGIHVDVRGCLCGVGSLLICGLQGLGSVTKAKCLYPRSHLICSSPPHPQFMCMCALVVSKGNLGCYPEVSCLPPLKQGLSLVWGSPIRLGWLAREPQRSVYVCLPYTGITHGNHRAHHFYMDSGHQTRVFMLAKYT